MRKILASKRKCSANLKETFIYCRIFSHQRELVRDILSMKKIELLADFKGNIKFWVFKKFERKLVQNKWRITTFRIIFFISVVKILEFFYSE